MLQRDVVNDTFNIHLVLILGAVVIRNTHQPGVPFTVGEIDKVMDHFSILCMASGSVCMYCTLSH